MMFHRTFAKTGVITLLLLLLACNRAPTDTGLLPTRTPSAVNEAASKLSTLDDCTKIKLDLSAPPIAGVSAGQIAYIDINGNIGVMDPSGGNNKQITNDANLVDRTRNLRSYLFPTFSNDAKTLAFVGVTNSTRTEGMTQTVYSAPITIAPKLTSLYTTNNNNIPYLDWSPDDQSVAILSINPTFGVIKVIKIATGDTREYDNGTTVYWHWRPDSGAMVTHTGGATRFNSGAKIALGDARSESARKLVGVPGDFQSPHYHPNGKTMLIVIDKEGENWLVVANATGAPMCAVTKLNEGGFFAWSPDGKRVALMDTKSPVFDPAKIEIIDITSGKRTPVKDKGVAFFWSPDGQRLAMFSIVTVESVGGVIADLNGQRQFTEQGVNLTQLPLLKIEIFDTTTNKNIVVAATVPTRDFATLLGFFDQYSRALTMWSPNSNSIVLTGVSVPRETSDIAIATVNASVTGVDLRPIGTGSVAFWSR
jgi:Tol biopolymer transport system component